MSHRAYWIGANPSGAHCKMRNSSDWAIKTGRSLENHARLAHGGETDPKCPACIEISSKMAKFKGELSDQAGKVSEVL